MSARRIIIEPVTRIEGHARITLQLDDTGNVEKSFLHVDEFRGVEKFSEGRPYFEMPQITQRICGICPVSHHLASAKACDEIAGLDPPRPAKLLRELMHMAQYVQSHGMHFFYLAAPDLLLGFDADPKVRNIFGIISADSKLAVKAVNLRRFGQQIIERLGGKRIHPNFAVPGGVNSPLLSSDRDAVLAKLDLQESFSTEALSIAEKWIAEHRETAENFAVFPSNYLGMVDQDGALRLYDGKLRISDSEGKVMTDFSSRNYLDFVAEHVEDWSFLKFPYFRALGWPQGSYRVGPLARLNIAERIDTPKAAAALKIFKQTSGGRPVEGSLYYHYARMIELVHALERIRRLLDDPDILSKDIRGNGGNRATGHGIGVVEAPRGTLIHDYTADENGLLTRVNLIVATGHNNWAMNTAVERVAKAHIHEDRLTEGNLNRVEAAVRCYDPCLSCSTHAIGNMPLVIDLVSPDGKLIRSLSRRQEAQS